MTLVIWQAIESILLSLTWFLPLLGPLVTRLLLLIFGLCLFNLVKFVSSRLQQFHIKTMALQEIQPVPLDIETLEMYQSPFDARAHRFRLPLATHMGSTPPLP